MSKGLWTISPLLEGSLKIRFDVVDLVLAEPELVSDKFSHLDELLPSVNDVGEIFPSSVSNLPSNDVLFHDTFSSPIHTSHVLTDMVLTVVLLPHELLEVGNLTLGFPVFCTGRTTVILIINQL